MKKGKKPYFKHCTLICQNILYLKLHIDQKYSMKKFEIFFLAYIHVFLKIISFNSKVFKSQRDSSITLHVSLKTAISVDKLKITSTKIQMLSQQNFPDWFGQKEIKPKRFWKYSMKNQLKLRLPKKCVFRSRKGSAIWTLLLCIIWKCCFCSD